jgi:hypothetical protein
MVSSLAMTPFAARSGVLCNKQEEALLQGWLRCYLCEGIFSGDGDDVFSDDGDSDDIFSGDVTFSGDLVSDKGIDNRAHYLSTPEAR